MTNRKIKIFFSMILIFLVVSVLVIQNNQLESVSTEKNEISDHIIEESSLPLSEKISKSIDYDQFYLGETVKTDIEFNKAGIDYTQYSLEGDFQDWLYESWGGYSEELQSGLPYLAITQYWNDIVGPTFRYYSYIFKLYLGGSGTFYYNISAGMYDSGVNYLSTGFDYADSMSVTSGMLDAEGYLIIRLYVISNINNAGDSIRYRLYYLDGTGENEICNDIESGTALVDMYKTTLRLDSFYAIRDTIINNVKSEYQYASPSTITHRLEIPSVPHAKEINIYYPDHWTYSSINPYASITDSSYTLTVNNPTELTYTIFFSSNCSNRLAVSDITNTEFEHIGFEDSEYYPDWISVDTEVLEIRTDIAVETYSLYFENNAGGMNLNTLVENGFYYVSFRYYQTTTNNFKFYWYNDGWISEELYTTGVTERWREKQLFIQVQGSNVADGIERNLVFYFSSGHYGKAYIDDFRIYQTSTIISSTGLDQYQISSTLRALDGYQNPSIPNEDVEFELYYSSLENSFSTTTNSEGVATWNLNKNLDLKEYQIRTYSINDHSCDSLYGWNHMDWLHGGVWSVAGAGYSTFTVYPDYLDVLMKVDSNGGACYPSVLLDSALDFTPFDKIVVDMSLNETEDHYSGLEHFLLYNGTDIERIRDLTDYPDLQDERIQYLFDYPEDSWSGSTDLTNIVRLYMFIFDGDIYDFVRAKIYDVYFIETVKYNFTSATFSEDPVLYETDTSFYLSSTNNTYQYEIYLDEQYLGIYSDLDVILKNNSYANHNLTFVLFTDGSYQAFIPQNYQYGYLVSLPAIPQNDIYRETSQGFFNITIITNLAHYWIDIYHDDILIFDDNISTFYSIEKALLVGWHNITFLYTYNSSIDVEGNPCEEYNTTLTYEFWYETKLFFDVRLRYVPLDLGLAIGDFHPSWVHTYIDGELVLDGDISDISEYSNYSFISNYDIRIRNNMPSHNLVIKDLFDRLIINTTIDISTFTYSVIELPIYRLGVINLDDESHKVAIRAFLTTETWQYTPELAPGYFIEFWVCNRTYEFRVYSIGESSYYDSNGVFVIIWEQDYAIPPRQVPTTITIPLDITPEEEAEIEKDNRLRNIGVGVGISSLVILIFVFIYLVRLKRKIKWRGTG